MGAWLWLGIVGLAGLAACKAPPLPESTVGPEAATIGLAPAPVTLGAGDRVRVDVYGHPELSSPESGVLVATDGSVSLPLIGAVGIDGRTTAEVTGELELRYARYLKEPRVSFSVMEYGARRVWVFGHVRAPGPYVMDRPLNALQALSLGRGFLEGADRESVCLLRAQGEFLEVHVFDAATPDAGGLVAVRPDDFLFVRQTGTGTFREQVLPILQGIQPALSSLINAGLVADAIND